MKKTLRMLALLTAILFLAIMLIGCSSKEQDDNDDVLQNIEQYNDEEEVDTTVEPIITEAPEITVEPTPTEEPIIEDIIEDIPMAPIPEDDEVIPTEAPVVVPDDVEEIIEPTEVPVKEPDITVEPTKTPTKAPTKAPTPKPEKEPTKVPEPTEVPKDEPNEVGYNGHVTINGVKIPKLTGFSDTLNENSWGADDYKDGDESNDYMYEAIQEYSKQMRKDIEAMNTLDNPGDMSEISVRDKSILVKVHAEGSQSPLRLSKEEDENCFEIYLSTALVYTELDKELESPDYTKITNGALRLLCSVVSSSPNELYTAIYDSWETDNNHGINTKSWTTIGDCQVRYVSSGGNGYGIYQIKSK